MTANPSLSGLLKHPNIASYVKGLTSLVVHIYEIYIVYQSKQLIGCVDITEDDNGFAFPTTCIKNNMESSLTVIIVMTPQAKIDVHRAMIISLHKCSC